MLIFHTLLKANDFQQILLLADNVRDWARILWNSILIPNLDSYRLPLDFWPFGLAAYVCHSRLVKPWFLVWRDVVQVVPNEFILVI